MAVDTPCGDIRLLEAEWRDVPSLGPAVTDPGARARMNEEIRGAIEAADGDQDAARQAILAIVQRYTENAAQAARSRPK